MAARGRSELMLDSLDPHEVERLRRSIAMLRPDQPGHPETWAIEAAVADRQATHDGEALRAALNRMSAGLGAERLPSSRTSSAAISSQRGGRPTPHLPAHRCDHFVTAERSQVPRLRF